MLHIREAIVVEGRYDKHTCPRWWMRSSWRPPALASSRTGNSWLLREAGRGAGAHHPDRLGRRRICHPEFPQGGAFRAPSGQHAPYPGPVWLRQASASRERGSWAWRGCVPRSWRRSCAERAHLLDGDRGDCPPGRAVAGHKGRPDAGRLTGVPDRLRSALPSSGR